MHCVSDAGALPGLGLTELGREPCDTIAHMGWMKSKEFKIPTKCVETELLQKMLLLNLISSAKWAGPTASAPEHKGSTSGHCKGNRRIKRAGWKKRPRPGAWERTASFLNACSQPAFQRGQKTGLCWPMRIIYTYGWVGLSLFSVNTGRFIRNHDDSNLSTAAVAAYLYKCRYRESTEAVGFVLHFKAWKQGVLGGLFWKWLERTANSIAISCAQHNGGCGCSATGLGMRKL